MVGAIKKWTKEEAQAMLVPERPGGSCSPPAMPSLSSGREAGFPSLSLSSSWASTRKVRLLTECLRTTANPRRALPSHLVLLYTP